MYCFSHGRMPGQCFPFKGDHGSIVIRLAVPVVPTEFVLEHLSKSISIVGHINSAPNNFTVYVSIISEFNQSPRLIASG